MNAPVAACLLALAACTMIGGAHAEPDPRIFLDIAERLQEEIRPQMAGAPDETRMLFEEGTRRVAALERAISDGDAEAAKENFHAAMTIFKEISGKHWRGPPADHGDGSDGLSGLLARMQAYADNLEAIAKKNGVAADFAGLDRLFARASQQIADGQTDAAAETLREAKRTIKMIHMELRGEVSEHEPRRFLAYAAKYIERLDGMIGELEGRGAPDQTVSQLRADLDAARDTLGVIRQHLDEGTDPGDLLRDLAKQLRGIKAALAS